ncbi:MAG: DNA (cytosine-5-)-methyltransferase [Bryobacterales bacterium]|nr:DNA (cytosine-5-)-methyltransferase [Bryobacterales bacterium]
MVGTQLRERRQQLGLSQAKLSELSGISQHLLSAFELDKAPLSPALLDALASALSDTTQVLTLANRTKRYQDHKYVEVPKLPDRVGRASRTPGSQEYIQVLEEIARLHIQEQNRDLSALSLFSGCGGFSLGFSAAGFWVKSFLEVDEGLRDIYKANFPHSLALGGDITSVDREALLRFANRLGRVDVVIGGPPCQGFSLAGKRKVDDPRNALFTHYLRFVDALRPKVAVLENVRLLTSMRSASGTLVKDDVCSSFWEHGYSVKGFEINSKDYGVPQHRERVLFVAMRTDLSLLPELPDCTHNECPGLFSTVYPYRTFGDACSDLPFIESGESSNDPLHMAVRHPSHVIEWLWDVPEGCSAHDNSDPSKRPPSGYNTTYKRQVWDEPAATVQTTFGMISGCRNVHPIATRSLTIREAARIQSFPDSYRFVGNVGTIRTGIGNAVPPLLAYRLAQHLRQRLQSL